jgi:hypothetical protein
MIYDCIDDFRKNEPDRPVSVQYAPHAADCKTLVCTDSDTEAAQGAPESEDELELATLGVGSDELELDELELETLALSLVATSSLGSALAKDMAFLESSSQSD